MSDNEMTDKNLFQEAFEKTVEGMSSSCRAAERVGMIEKAKSILPDGYWLMYLTYHGSRLYGTNTPASDTDIKGVYLPPLRDVVLGTYSKSFSDLPVKGKDEKNKAGDVEICLYSIQEFLKMCIEGETIAIDMLNSNSYDHCMLYCSISFKTLLDNHQKFYTKDMKAFLGYCRKQAAKYGIRGSRMGCLEQLIELVSVEPEEQVNTNLTTTTIKLQGIKGKLPLNEFCQFNINEKTGIEFYRVLESDYQLSITLKEFKTLMQKKWEMYGERSRQAKNNEGIDWKAISHAFRAGLQLAEIYETGEIKYPLKDREYLKEIKEGKIDFGYISEELEEIIYYVGVLAERSNYPKKVDKVFWDEYILKLYNL